MLDELVARFGPWSARAAKVVVLVAERPRGLAELVGETGLSRRSVEAVLALAGARPDGATFRLATVPDGLAEHVRPRGTPERSDLLGTLTAWIDGAPAARRDLDHVAATPETALRRARWLDEQYDLATTPLLFVGDHDLTALAVTLVNPAARAAVVDVDEELLAHIDRTAVAHGLAVDCRYADLRFGLPPDLVGFADVAFTDPPYTPEGVRLFAAAALRGLRHREYGQVVISYGTGDGQPALGLKVQQALAGLGLYTEAMLPAFNRYRGAQAVGSRSDLYVCRATARTWRHLDRADPRTAIYTHGAQSLESTPRRVPELANLLDGEIAGVVGEDWPAGPPTTRLGTFLGSGLPPAIRRRPGTVVVDLAGDPGPWLLRSLLAATVPRLVAVVPDGHPDLAAPVPFVGLKYALDVRRHHPARGLATVTAEPVPVGELDTARRVQRHVLDRATATLASAWRDALVRHAGHSRDAARAAVTVPPGLRLLDLPRHRIAALLEEIATSVA
ncbi:bis-aminopropyl spermidine synthase family protein [Pseudonocardia sp. CA-107938]|uniref:bis-aminopropyl spermidine synthase family protein n=1 Tax=Pseudonocardia sp. CA-107938 TaxID=3240021 RepID=UPI003D903738